MLSPMHARIGHTPTPTSERIHSRTAMTCARTVITHSTIMNARRPWGVVHGVPSLRHLHTCSSMLGTVTAIFVALVTARGALAACLAA